MAYETLQQSVCMLRVIIIICDGFCYMHATAAFQEPVGDDDIYGEDIYHSPNELVSKVI